MDIIPARTAAENWNISQRRVAILCSEGRIPGAERVGNMWVIPSNAKKPVDGRSIRYMKKERVAVKPFVKWAGGKGQLLDSIRSAYPSELGKSIKKYAEPFVGGGAVLFDILSNYDLDEIYISDINAELINTYKIIRDNVDAIIDLLSVIQNEYLPLGDEERKVYYYNKRDRFNELKVNGKSSDNIEGAALFIFLNRTCFNGLYRVNSKNLFNVPIGSYKKPLICDANNLLNTSKLLKNVDIVCGDYRKSESFIDSKTFVYFDPPYRPLNVTSSFTSYTENEFGDLAQQELAEFVNKMDRLGAYVVASNSDPKNVDPNDDFFEKIYSAHKIKRVEANRMINCNSEARGKIKELLISNF